MGNNTREKIGLRISKLRESHNLSQAQLASELGKMGLKVRRETVTQWENGTRDLKTEYTIKLAEFFDVSCDYILRGIAAENLSAAEETGLTNEAITHIRTVSKISEADKAGSYSLNYVQNKVLTTDYLRLILCFRRYMEMVQNLKTTKERILEVLENRHEPIPENLEESLVQWTMEQSPMRNYARVYFGNCDEVDLAYLRLDRCIRDITEQLKKEIENG